MEENVEKKKHQSPRNGDIVKNHVYSRRYDFNRDAWYNLINKLTSAKWRETESNFISNIERKLSERIRKGRCTQEQVDNMMKFRLDRLEKRNLNKKIMEVVEEKFEKVEEVEKESIEDVISNVFLEIDGLKPEKIKNKKKNKKRKKKIDKTFKKLMKLIKKDEKASI